MYFSKGGHNFEYQVELNKKNKAFSTKRDVKKIV